MCTYQKCKDNEINDYCVKYSINDNKFIDKLKIDNKFCKNHLVSYIRIMYELNDIFNENDLNTFIQCNGCKMYLPNDIFEGCLTCKICRNRIKTKKYSEKCLSDNCKFEQLKFNK